MAVICHHTPFGGRLLIPNTAVRYGEADVLMLSKAGYATEFEIKISRNDFNADKNKISKHCDYQKLYNNMGKEPLLEWNNKPKSLRGIPNYFVYVVPSFFNLDTLKVPKYAGLWIFDIEHGAISVSIPPPKIHKEKQQEFWRARIAKSFNSKYFYHYFCLRKYNK